MGGPSACAGGGGFGNTMMMSMRGSVGGGREGTGGGGRDVRRFHALIWTVSAVSVTLPWLGGVLGPAGAWCWIDARKGRRAQAFRLVCFYLPLWSIVAFQVLVYYRVIKRLIALTRLAAATRAMQADMRREEEARAKMRALAAAAAGGSSISDVTAEMDGGERGERGGGGEERAADGDVEEEVDVADTLKRLLRRIGAYPLILIVAWFFPTVNRLLNWFHDGGERGDFYSLYVLQALGMSTQGISNMMVYGASAAVRRHVWESLEKMGCCGGVDWGGGGTGVGRGSATLGLRGVAREMEMRGSGSSGGRGGGGGGVIRSAAPGHSNAMTGNGGDGDLTSGAHRSNIHENEHDSDGKEVLLEVDLSTADD